MTRIAQSFLRFGSFEICKHEDALTGRAGPSAGQTAPLLALLDHVASLLLGGGGGGDDDAAARAERHAAAFGEIVRRTAALAAAWQCVGFCHGVLNTDNMSVVGVTIDYGPFGFLGSYDPDFVCNGSDNSGRYSYAAQPERCGWNCERLAEAIAPVLPPALSAPHVAAYRPAYDAAYLNGMRAKLGLRSAAADDAALVTSLLDVMRISAADFTATFRTLSSLGAVHPPAARAASIEALLPAIARRCGTAADQAEALARRAAGAAPQVGRAQLEQLLTLLQTNPAALAVFGHPEAVAAEVRAEVEKLRRSDEMRAEAARLRAEPPAQKRATDDASWRFWLEKYCDRLAADEAAAEAEAAAAARRAAMRAANPRVVLHNWVAQEAIDAAERGDDAAVARVLDVLMRPYDDGDDHFADAPPPTMKDLCVT